MSRFFKILVVVLIAFAISGCFSSGPMRTQLGDPNGFKYDEAAKSNKLGNGAIAGLIVGGLTYWVTGNPKIAGAVGTVAAGTGYLVTDDGRELEQKDMNISTRRLYVTQSQDTIMARKVSSVANCVSKGFSQNWCMAVHGVPANSVVVTTKTKVAQQQVRQQIQLQCFTINPISGREEPRAC